MSSFLYENHRGSFKIDIAECAGCAIDRAYCFPGMLPPIKGVEQGVVLVNTCTRGAGLEGRVAPKDTKQ